MHATMTNLPGDLFEVTVESQTIQGQSLHALMVQVGGASVRIWLTPEQLGQVEFACSVAQQEASLGDYCPEGGPDGDERLIRAALWRAKKAELAAG